MKKTIFALLLGVATTAHAQTLFTYGKYPVDKYEFLRAYNKNNTSPSNTEKSYRDYLELYIRFKLKVQAAYDARLDTIAGQNTELQNFRSQIVDGFMNDESAIQELINEAFDRSQKDIRVSTIIIPFRGGDTSSAYNRAMEAYNKIQSGADFGSIAEGYSADPEVHTNKGDIGYITAFVLPYEMETLVYKTAIGKTSFPYRTKAAYIIFKPTAERPDIGRMKAMQILVGFMPNPDQAEKEKKRILADSIYTALQQGASFVDMVKKYSTDNISYQANGLMPEFGTGRYSAAFEKAAFDLTKDQEISKPVLTEFGYHIIMRVARIPVNKDRNNQAAMQQLKQQVQNDRRIQVAKEMMAVKAMKQSGFKPGNFNQKEFILYADSVYANRKSIQRPTMNDKTVLFSFTRQSYTAADFGKYVRSIMNAPELLRGKSSPQLLQQYEQVAGMEYYRNHLEQFNKEFAAQLKEFKDGNLLFEIMQRRIWDKAANDSAGLKKFYAGHKDKYWWEPSVDAILFTCSDSLIAAKALDRFKSNPGGWKDQVQNSDGTVQADSGRFELSQLPNTISSHAQAGAITPLAKNANDNVTSFAYITNVYTQRMPRSFEDARGFVINDYQTLLEDKWIATLKQKYPVKVNESVLAGLWK